MKKGKYTLFWGMIIVLGFSWRKSATNSPT